MSFSRSALVAAAILVVIVLGGGPAHATTSSSSTSSMIDDLSEWTSKQWNRARAEWAKEREKWADCRKQSKDQNLTSLKSWSFLASCMTRRATPVRSSKRALSSTPSARTTCWNRLAAAAQFVGSRLPVVNDIEMIEIKATTSVPKGSPFIFERLLLTVRPIPTRSACRAHEPATDAPGLLCSIWSPFFSL